MMKKTMLAVIFFTAVSQIWPISLGFGLGPLAGMSWSKSETDSFDNTAFINSTSVLSYKTQSYDIGGFAFGDCTYALLNIGYMQQNITMSSNTKTTGATTSSDDENATMTQKAIVLDLLGKFPFAPNDSFALYPLLGLGARIKLADSNEGVTWALSLKTGFGIDYGMTRHLFLRFQALFSLQLTQEDAAVVTILKPKNLTTFPTATKGYNNLGPVLHLAIGYKIPLGYERRKALLLGGL